MGKIRPLHIAGGYLMLSLLFAWELVLPRSAFFRWDTLIYSWPVHMAARDQWLAGHLPVWAGSFACGTPFLGNITAALFYPLRLLHVLLPVHTGFKLFVFAHVWLGLVGTHLFLRKGLGRDHTAALVGALCFAAGGYARGMWDTMNFLAMPWIPLAFWALLGAGRTGGFRRSVLGMAAALLLMLLGGDTQAAMVWVAAAGLLALFHPRRGRLLAALALATVSAVLLAAPQWLPTLHAMRVSYRAEGLPFDQATERSFHPLRLVELFVPHAFGTHAHWYAGGLFAEGARNLSPWTASFHIGIVPLLAVAGAWRRRRHYAVRWALALAAGALLLSFGQNLPGYAWWLRLPVVGGFRFPEKYLLWTSFGLAVLAAYGTPTVIALWRDRASWRPRAVLVLGWLGGLAVCWLVARWAAPRVILAARAETDLAGFSAWLVRQGILSGLIALPLVVSLPFAIRRRWPFALAAALSLVAPWYMEQPLTRAFDPMTPPPLAEAIASSHAPQGRFLGDPAARLVPLPDHWHNIKREDEREAVYFASALTYNSARVWGLRAADGFSPLESNAMRALRLNQARPYAGTAPPVEGLAAFCRAAAVQWLLTTPERAAELEGLGLDVYAYRRWQDESDQSVLVYIDGQSEARLEPVPDPDAPEQPVVLTRSDPGRIAVDLAPERPSVLVVSESYDPGWHATDQSGRALPVIRYDDAWIGVEVDRQTERVVLAYAPPGLIPGLAAAVCGALLLLWVGGVARFTRHGRCLPSRATAAAE